MQVRFRTNTLKRQYEISGKAISTYGDKVGKKYIERINIIKKSHSIEDLKIIRPLRCHQLKGKRKGEWAINLTEFYRLIFTLHGNNLEIAQIEEVSKHYDD